MCRPIMLFLICWFSPSIVFCAEEADFIKRPAVHAFIQQMVKKHHFNAQVLNQLFAEVKVRPTVMKNIRAPLELNPWHTYQNLFLTEWRIRNGVIFWKKYQDALQAVEKKYGVPASIIVATIGIETKYGKHTGDFRVIDALTNIAFSQSPRAPYFKGELEEFLLFTREQQINPLKVMGSYAGAIGQPQFMPSSYRRYAVSYTGQGKIDLSHNELDVIASIANYYKQKGWWNGAPIAMPASLLQNKSDFLIEKNHRIKIIAHVQQKLFPLPSKTFLRKNQPYQLLQLQNFWGKEYWYTFHNFGVIKRYNVSDLYAMAVLQLSHYITVMKEG